MGDTNSGESYGDHNTLEINRLQIERDSAHRAIDDLTARNRELSTDLAKVREERDRLLAAADIGRRTMHESRGPVCSVDLACVDAVGVAESMRALVATGKVPESTRPVWSRVASQILAAARLRLGLAAKEERAEVVS
jgi:hypothetical protein